MIYMEPNSLGFDVLFQSWLATTPPALKSVIRSKLQLLFDNYVGSVLSHLRRYLIEPLPTVNNCLVDALLNLLDTFLVEYHDKDDGSEKKSPETIKAFGDKVLTVTCYDYDLL